MGDGGGVGGDGGVFVGLGRVGFSRVESGQVGLGRIGLASRVLLGGVPHILLCFFGICSYCFFRLCIRPPHPPLRYLTRV